MKTKSFLLACLIMPALFCAATGNLSKVSSILTPEGVQAAQESVADLPKRQENGRLLQKFNLLALAIDLSDEQKVAIRNIVSERKEELPPLLIGLSSDRQALREMIRGGQNDEAAIRRIVENQTEARIELTLIRTKIRADVFNVLSHEQQDKAKALLTAAFNKAALI